MQFSNDFKTDWQDCRNLFKSWWNVQNEEPMICNFKVNEAGKDWKPLPAPTDYRELWTDIDGNIDRVEDQMAHWVYEGANFPNFSPSLGPGSLSLFLGATPTFRPDTVWYEPCFDSISKARASLDPDNEWYVWTKKALIRARERSQGKYMLAIPDIIEGLDCAAEMVGNAEILYALMDEPAEVHRFLREITDCYHQVFDELYEIVSPDNDGNCFIAFQILGDGKTAKFQSDISAMLSPGMFDEFVLPYLTEHTEKVDYSLYHLDGPSAIVHADSLCSIKTLNAIQWVPGAGNPESWDERWYGLYEKILGSGKGLQVVIGQAHLDKFLKRFACKGLYVLVW